MSGLRLCVTAEMKSENFFMTAVRSLAFEMRHSAMSMYLHRTQTLGSSMGLRFLTHTTFLRGSGKSMRHVQLKPGLVVQAAALTTLIQAAFSDIKMRVEHR